MRISRDAPETWPVWGRRGNSQVVEASIGHMGPATSAPTTFGAPPPLAPCLGFEILVRPLLQVFSRKVGAF